MMKARSDSENEKGVLSRRDFLKSTAVAAAGMAATGMLEGITPYKAGAQPPQGTINVVTSADADSYDAHSWISDDGKMIGTHIFEALVDRDYQPMLSTSWENPDKLTWVFHLKKDVTFTNGEPFDASVVKFNLERYLDPKTKALYRGMLEPLESLEVLDKHTVKIKTKTPYSIFLYVLGEINMMSPKAIQEYGGDVVRKPVGTGPYAMKEWIPKERTVIETNPAFHGTKPKVKTIIWRPVSEPSTRIVELQSGRADIINRVPPELLRDISGPDVEAVRRRSLWRMGIMLNCGSPPFDNIKVRQALNYAVNKEDIIKYVLQGAGYLATDPLGPDRVGKNPELKAFPYDPERAKKLLREAGHGGGVECEITVPSGRYLKDKEVMEALAFQVKDSGFNMKLQFLEWGMFLKSYKKANGYFIASVHRESQKILSIDGDSRAKSYAWFGYHNDEFNRLLDEAGETFEVEKRNAIYRKVSQIFWEDAANVWMYYGQDIYGVRKRIKDFVPRADAYILLMKSSTT